MGRTKRFRALVLLLLGSAILTGCDYTGLNSFALPGGKGGADDDLRVTVILENSTNLVPNSEVRYDEVVVGAVRKIEFEDWHAKLTLGIERDAGVPADVTAKVAQKSLLGAEYLELSSLDHSEATGELLADGTELGPDRTGRYPETEEVLSAAALLLNGGGLPNLRTIAHETNAALSGRTDDLKALVRNLSTFVSAIDDQRDAIVGALRAVDDLSVTVQGQRSAIDRALSELPRGIKTLQRERTALVRSLSALDGFAAVANRVYRRTHGGIVANLHNLRPLTKQLADHAASLVGALDVITFPFPIKAINRAFFGDYINFFATMNLDLRMMAKFWTEGTSLSDLAAILLGITPTTTGSTDPLQAPMNPTSAAGGANGTQKQTNQSVSVEDNPNLLLDGLVGGVLGGAQ